MSDTGPSNPRPPRGESRKPSFSRTVTVEVRRKKVNLLDRRKALSEGGAAGKPEAPSQTRPARTASGLTASEVDARMQALKKASQTTMPTLPERVRHIEKHEEAQPVAPTEETTVAATPSMPEPPRAEVANSTPPVQESSGRIPQNADLRRAESQGESGAKSEASEMKAELRRPVSTVDRAQSAGFERGDRRGFSDRPQSAGFERGGRRGFSDRPQSGGVERGDRRGFSDRPRSSFGDRKPGFGKKPGEGERSAPVILRAASYGPSPQQLARDKEEAARKRPEEGRGRGDRRGSGRDGGFASQRPFGGNDDSLFSSGKETHTRVVKPKKTFEDLDRNDSNSKGRKAGSETPRRLTRNVLNRFMDDEDEMRMRSLAAFKRAQKKRLGGTKAEPAKVIRDVVIPDSISVSELASRMAVSSALVVKSLMKQGIMASMNQMIDGDTAELICLEFGHRPKRDSEDAIEIAVQRTEDRPEDMLPRPPIVTVMGHVDHGKTSLLDALRKTDIIATEFGGITQHIGAYQIVTPFSDAKITFLDTPGHAAFSEMRARGANVTDIVVLVVAADDSVNVQTVEAIAHAKAANAPMIVAINKIDKPAADPQRIRNELLNHEVVLEDFGGDVMSVEISAKQGTNLDKLVEAILLQSEVLELKANPKGPAEGAIVEASVEKGRGTVATVLVQRGTLRPGDIFVAGTEFGRVKSMHDFRGKKVTEAGPSCPVGVLGFNGVPRAGDAFLVVESEQRAREIAEHRRQVRLEKEAGGARKISAEQLMSQIAQGEAKVFNIVLKADTQGSLEAITNNLLKLNVEEVTAKVVHGAIGDINETDILLAKTSNAHVIGFNVHATPQARSLAQREGISMSHYTVIYELFENVSKMMRGLLAPTFEEKVLGQAELRVVFSKGKFTKIAGCYVLSGLIRRANAQIRVRRGKDVVFTGRIETMKHEKDDIKESREGHECGIILDGFNDLEVGDILECFEVVEVKPE